MTTKNILVLILGILITISILTTVFKKEYKVLVLTEIHSLAFNDTIVSVNYFKDDYGSGIETKLKNHDTAFCFSGFSEKLHSIYLDFAKKGDLIIKEKNVDSFFIKRNDSLISFTLSECH
jgi:secreted Zn-dependent insulinase-like peptidase